LPFAVDDPTYRLPELPDLSRHHEVDFDVETTGLDVRRGDRPVGLAIGTAEGTHYLPFGHRSGENLDSSVVRSWATRELRGKRLRGLNLKFDLHMMRAWGVDLRDQDNTFHDVAHSAALLDDHRTSFSLEALAQAELGEGKGDVFHGSTIADLPAGAVASYAQQDVALVRRLYEAYAPRLASEALERVSTLEDDLIPAVVEMEANGIPLNLPLLDRWLSSSAKLVETLSWQFYKLTGFVLNPDAATDMTRLWLQCKEPITRTETGAPSFTAPIVQDAATRHPAILLAWRLGKLMDLRSKYLEKYMKDQRHGVLYPELHQLRTDDGGTVSGRFSCVRPNMQQVMGKDKHSRMYGWLTEYGEEDYLVKRLCLPGAGVWFSTDARQLEYRIFAHYTESPRLLAEYAKDPHVDFHNIVKPMLLPQRPNITRTEVKTFNFLKIFGGGAAAASRNLGISLADAEDINAAYARQFPEADALLRKAMDRASAKGYVKTALGRRGRFPLRERLHKALNSVVQGTAADLVKLKMVRLHQERKRLELTPRMMVHDAFEGDLPSARHLAAVEEVLAVQELPLRVPVLWSSHTGPSWAEAD
jgi:DNA polymerase-1